MDMSAVISSVGEIIPALTAWARGVIELITGTPLLLFLLLVFTVGGGVIGIVHRLIRG